MAASETQILKAIGLLKSAWISMPKDLDSKPKLAKHPHIVLGKYLVSLGHIYLYIKQD